MTQAWDGQRALDAFSAIGPDLVILDWMLPKLDGLVVCRRIREQSIVPIIFIGFLLPGIAYGIAAGTLKTHRDVVGEGGLGGSGGRERAIIASALADAGQCVELERTVALLADVGPIRKAEEIAGVGAFSERRTCVKGEDDACQNGCETGHGGDP